MKVDIKMMVIIALALVVIGFIMFGGKSGVDTDAYENERISMQNKIDSLEVLKGYSDNRIVGLEDDYNEILKDYNIKIEQNDSLTSQIEYQSSIISSKTIEYNKTQKKINKLNKELSDLKDNPTNREDEELINNLQKTFN